MKTKSLGQNIALGSAWMIAMRWSMRLIGLGSTIILARLLLPSDFGIVAMALIVVGLLETITFTGVDLALIRDNRATPDHYNTAWTVQLGQGVLVCVLLFILAPYAGTYFDEPRVTNVIRLMSFNAVLEGLQNIGVVAFRKELDFAKEFRFNLYKKLLSFCVIVAAALMFRNYWALVIGMLSGTAIGAALSYAMHPYRPRLSISKLGEIWSFSQWLLISRIGSFFNQKTDQLIVGGTSGTGAMGGYHLAAEIASMPTSELVMPMRRALFPTLSTALGKPALFRSAVLQTCATVALLCSALGFGLAGVADLFTLLVLGDRWQEAIPLMRWLAILGAFSAPVGILEVTLWVKGKTHFSALLRWLELAMLVPLLLYTTAQFGVEGAAAGRCSIALVTIPLMMLLTSRATEIPLQELYASCWRPWIAGLAMMAVLFAVDLAPVGIIGLAGSLLFEVVVGASVFCVCVAALWILAGKPEGVEDKILSQVRRRMPQRS